MDNQGNVREAFRPFFPTPPGVAPTFANARRAEMVVRLDGNQTTQQEGAATVAVTRAVQAVSFDGFTTSTTGAPALLKVINDYLMGGMLVLGAIAVVVMIVVLSAAFRVRWRLVPLVVMALGVVWTFGLLGYVGFQLSIVTIAGLPILIGLGVEFAIQMQNRLEEEIVAGPALGESPGTDGDRRLRRARAAPHRSGPAGGHGGRRHRLPGPEGVAHPHDPRLRGPAGRGDRVRLPGRHRRARRPAVHP